MLRCDPVVWDEEAELLCYGYRYYNSSCGRWLGRDPIEETGGVNTYSLVDNSPENYCDPFGLFDVGGFGSGAVGIVAEPFKMGSDLIVVAMIACHNATSKNQIYAEDTAFLSAIANRQIARVVDGQGPLETSFKGGGEVIGNMLTGGALGTGENIYENLQAYSKGQITIDQLDYNLSKGAGAQLGAVALGSGVSKASGYGWNGAGEYSGSLDQELINSLVFARQVAGKSANGNATFSVGASEDGTLSPVTESLENPSLVQGMLNGGHAEPQVIDSLQGAGSKTLAVDQKPCRVCTLRMFVLSFKSPVRVIGPKNPNPLSDTGVKGSALGGALGKYSPIPQDLGAQTYKPPIIYPLPNGSNGK